jgi:GGDEF domain-containing protein/CHASE3 domain sensor protein
MMGPSQGSGLTWFFDWKPFSRLTIAGKMLVGYAVLVVLTVTVVSYVLVSLSRINVLSRSIITVNIPVDTAAGRLLETLLAQNTYEKRFLILRRQDLSHLYWERAKEFTVSLEELKRIDQTGNLPLETIEKLHERYGDLYLEMTGYVRKNKMTAAEALSNGDMSNVVDRLFELIRSIPPKLRASRDEQMRMIDTATRTTLRTTILLCTLSTVFSILASLLVTLYIASSLRKLKAAAGHVAEGNFEYGSLLHAEDEIGDLDRSFDIMRMRLKKLEEMYRDASPLTRLPGGIAIEQDIQRRLDRNEPIAVCVMDIDNFKSVNDRYGYAHGNEVIIETARIVDHATKSQGTPSDFVGHIGGDDFVAVTSPERMNLVCDEIIAQFDEKAPQYYSDRDRQNGYIAGKSRQGVEMKFPLMTISIAVVTNLQRKFSSPLEISAVAVELKEYAKTFQRSLYVVDKRRS